MWGGPYVMRRAYWRHQWRIFHRYLAFFSPSLDGKEDTCVIVAIGSHRMNTTGARLRMKPVLQRTEGRDGKNRNLGPKWHHPISESTNSEAPPPPPAAGPWISAMWTMWTNVFASSLSQFVQDLLPAVQDNLINAIILFSEICKFGQWV